MSACASLRILFFLRLTCLWVGLVAGAPFAKASIHECRGLYSFVNNLNSRWPEQPALQAVGVTPSYSLDTIGAGSSMVLNVPALSSSQSYVLTNWARDNGSNTVGQCNRWTLALDIKPTFSGSSPYLAILQTNVANTDDGEIFLHSNGSLYAAGTVVPAGTFTANVWQRLVVTCDGNSTSGLTLKFFRNGVLVGTKTGQPFNGNYSIGAKALLFTDNNGETNPMSVGALAFWTEPLADGLFGSPSYLTPEFTWASIPAANALPGLNRELLFGSFKLTLPASGFLLGDGTVNVGSGASARAGYTLTANIPVRYFAGSLVYTGSSSYTLSNGPAYSIDNVRMTATNVVVNSTGATGNLKVDLPVGMGINTVETSRRVKNSFNLTGVSLATNLDPPNLSILPSHFGGTDKMFLSLEEMPVRHELTSITWAGGAFLCTGSNTAVKFHRADQRERTKVWNAYPGVLGDPRFSNDDSFAFVASRNGNLIIDADTDEQAKIRDLDLVYTTSGVNQGYTTHFPKGLPITWSAGVASRLTFVNGARQAGSYLYEALGVSVSMPREAPGKTCGGAANKNFDIFIPDHWLHTKDYGFRAPVQITNAGTIEWGAIDASNFAHRINTTISTGWMMIPGSKIKASEVPFVDIRQRASALLLSGIGMVDNPDRSERPSSSGYAEGLADYAGLNLRVGNSTVQSTSRLAGTPVNYELRNTSKYYIRSSGITGIHESKDVSGPGVYPINALLAGYNFGLTAVRLSFRDINNIDSGILGNLNLPEPAGLQDLRFKSLRFGPRGELLSATPETQAPFRLSYWQTQITPMAINFALPAGTSCPNPASSMLVMGVSAKLPAVSDQSFTGNIGFKNDGHTVTPGDNMVLPNGELVTSRLRPPSQMTVKGPGTSTYRFTPIGPGAYLNDSYGNLPARGFIAIPGELDVPFFRDLRVLLQASAASESEAGSELNIISGDVDGFSFWSNSTTADPWNTGVPPLGSDGEQQKALAKRNWIDVINYQLPVTWDNGLRRFDSPYNPNVRGDMILFSLPQRVNRLGPESAELSFGYKNANAETLNYARLQDSKSGGDALLQNINTRLGGGGLTNTLSNFDLFEQLLGDSLEKAFGAALDAAVKDAGDALYAGLVAEYTDLGSAGYKNGGGTIGTRFTTAGTTVNGALSALVNGGGWTTAIITRLDALQLACEDLRTIARTPSKIAQIAAGVTNATPPSPAAVQVLAAELDASLTELIDRIGLLRTQYNSGAMKTEMALRLGDTSWRTPAMDVVKKMWVTELDDPTGNYFSTSKQAAFTQSFQRVVRSAFIGSESAGRLRTLFGYSFAEVGSLGRNGFDGVLKAANELVQISRPIPNVEVPALNTDLATVFSATGVHGYACINGDNLNEVRLDGELNLKVPTTLKMKAWFLLKSVDALSPGDGASAAAGITNEVAVGASTTVQWFDGGPSYPVSAELKVGCGADGKPITVCGGVGLDGELDVQGIKLINPQLGAGFGGPNAYLYAKAAAKMEIGSLPLSAEAAIFVGKTATLDPIKKVNTEIAGKLGAFNLSNGPIIGSYVYGYGQFSVLPLFGIPATPLLDIQVGGGSGFYLFYQGGSGDLITGLQQVYGVSGEVLCLVSVSGRLDSYITINTNLDNPSFANTTGSGSAIATLRGEIGYDPFSVSWSKNFRFDITFGSAQSPKVQTHVSY